MSHNLGVFVVVFTHECTHETFLELLDPWEYTSTRHMMFNQHQNKPKGCTFIKNVTELTETQDKTLIGRFSLEMLLDTSLNTLFYR